MPSKSQVGKLSRGKLREEEQNAWEKEYIAVTELPKSPAGKILKREVKNKFLEGSLGKEVRCESTANKSH
jgi:acyl-coenzyme A synthetase/AMP-(fatty) acid ligase